MILILSLMFQTLGNRFKFKFNEIFNFLGVSPRSNLSDGKQIGSFDTSVKLNLTRV